MNLIYICRWFTNNKKNKNKNNINFKYADRLIVSFVFMCFFLCILTFSVVIFDLIQLYVHTMAYQGKKTSSKIFFSQFIFLL